MGMSASQARLLSITGRLTDNELKSTFITNDKMRLAAEQLEATNAYTNALDAEQLMFMGYDNYGAQTKVALTPALLYQYEPLKNQYILMNSSNKMLVGHLEAKNYEETDKLSDFLRRYDLLEDVNISRQQNVHNPEYDTWVEKHKQWKELEPVEENYWYDDEEVTTIKKEKFIHTDSRVYNKLNSITPCFDITHSDGKRCYSHVLAAILGEGTFTTSDGNTFSINYIDALTRWNWNTCSSEEARLMDGLRDELKNDPVYDQAYDGDLNTELHGIVPVKGDGSDAAKYNSGGTIGGGCWQKCIDLIWELKEMGYDSNNDTGGQASLEQLQKFWYFIEFDLGEGKIEEVEEDVTTPVKKFKNEEWEEDVQKWKDSEPPEVPETIMTGFYEEVIVVKDKDKAQWYTNLWYKMNGSDSANLVRIDDETKEKYEELQGKTVLKLEAAEKAEFSDNYEEYDSNLFNSAEWLQFALEHGVVTMEKASFYDPSEDFGRNLEKTADGIFWKPTIYTNASDFKYIEDSEAIEIAEVEYNRRKRAIQAKDKEYDADLRKLDTEHNALQTEYESLKNIIEKNVGRSFKTFS